ncbi:hypothetical protein FW320_00025 [Azospirillum sp. Vi22]|uniref:hypothetical protein n=1 Tax=Azospirillum baldaniorum TaxID=1064539 RepID=UPI00157B51C1|nr:hypothetical protein [Azospirillum baldaniorum]NUB04583.1 hypothetical protein [Azospirillum baldaniorum]
METPLEGTILAAHSALVILETLPTRMGALGSDPAVEEACNILSSAVRVLDEGKATNRMLLLVAHVVLQAARTLEVNTPSTIAEEDCRLAAALLRAQANKIVALSAGGVA